MFPVAPATAPVTLETAFVQARARAAKPAEDPISVLSRAAAPAEKLAALETLHSSLPLAPQARRTKGLAAIRAVASDAAEAPAVRAKALMYLGYAVPVVGDEATRAAAVRTLLDAARTGYRVYALRGLAPATHDLPASVEEDCQTTLLDLLGGSLNEEERVTALLALDAFVRTRDDMPRRRPDLVAALERKVLAPVEAGPAVFAATGSSSTRGLILAVIWHSARNRAANGELAALARANALLTALTPLETDSAVKAEIASFLAAPPPELLKTP